MRYSLVGQLPRHLYVDVDCRFTRRAGWRQVEGGAGKVDRHGFEPAVWFGLVSYPGRMWGCTVMLESGAVYRNLPPQALAFLDALCVEIPWSAALAQTWDCYGWEFTTIEYDYLRGLDCIARVGPGGREEHGTYLFTVAPVGDGFSAAPEQAKEFTFIRLDQGRLTIQPTDRVVFCERSFTAARPEFPESAFPKGLRRQREVYSCE